MAALSATIATWLVVPSGVVVAAKMDLAERPGAVPRESGGIEFCKSTLDGKTI